MELVEPFGFYRKGSRIIKSTKHLKVMHEDQATGEMKVICRVHNDEKLKRETAHKLQKLTVEP